MNYYRSIFSLLKTVLLAVVSLAVGIALHAVETKALQPADLVKFAFNEITTELKANSELYKENAKQLQAVVEKGASPYFNFQRMTQIAAARYWHDASDEQKSALAREFTTQLIRSYAHILFNYRNAAAEVVSEELNDKGRMMVKLNVKDDRGELIHLFLLMEKNQEQWQIIDVNVEGVSIVVTSRNRFSDEITQKGLDGFIQSLKEENQRLAL